MKKTISNFFYKEIFFDSRLDVVFRFLIGPNLPNKPFFHKDLMDHETILHALLAKAGFFC